MDLHYKRSVVFLVEISNKKAYLFGWACLFVGLVVEWWSVRWIGADYEG